jgi:hypothetical protein
MLLDALNGLACGAVAALIAWAAARGARNRRKTFATVSGVTFVVLASLSHALVVPQVRGWQIRRTSDQVLDENAFLKTLSDRHPEIREMFAALMVEAVRPGSTREEVNARSLAFGRRLVEPYFSRYAPRASDAALARYVGVMVAVLDDLAGRDPDGCFRLLFGQGTQGAAAAISVSPAHRQEMSAAMVEVVESALHAPAAPADPAAAEALIATVTGRMAERHGPGILASLESLANPAAPGVDHAGACNATREMYREALRLPAADSGTLLRFLFTP